MSEFYYRPVAQGGCVCVTWMDHKVVPLGSETATFLDDEFERILSRTPWLDLVRCRVCGQAWYAATDTVEDDYYFRRLTASEVTAITDRGEWPADYDAFPSVWPPDSIPGRRPHGRPWQVL